MLAKFLQYCYHINVKKVRIEGWYDERIYRRKTYSIFYVVFCTPKSKVNVISGLMAFFSLIGEILARKRS